MSPVDCRGNQLVQAGGKAIAGSIAGMSSLTSLNLGCVIASHPRLMQWFCLVNIVTDFVSVLLLVVFKLKLHVFWCSCLIFPTMTDFPSPFPYTQLQHTWCRGLCCYLQVSSRTHLSQIVFILVSIFVFHLFICLLPCNSVFKISVLAGCQQYAHPFFAGRTLFFTEALTLFYFTLISPHLVKPVIRTIHFLLFSVMCVTSLKEFSFWMWYWKFYELLLKSKSK